MNVGESAIAAKPQYSFCQEIDTNVLLINHTGLVQVFNSILSVTLTYFSRLEASILYFRFWRINYPPFNVSVLKCTGGCCLIKSCMGSFISDNDLLYNVVCSHLGFTFMNDYYSSIANISFNIYRLMKLKS